MKLLNNENWYKLHNVIASIYILPVIVDRMAERGRGWVGVMPSFFVSDRESLNSPYINHFISPDTIIPNQTNSQVLNRYSYVNNNPLRYTDPTGHVLCGDGEEHDCNGHKQDPNQNPHPPKPPKPHNDPKDILHHQNDAGSPLVSIAGALLTISLGVLDGVIGYGIVASAATAPVGLVAEVVLIPLEILSVDLTVYAAQMAATGRTDHDPLLVIHGFFPNLLPYKP